MCTVLFQNKNTIGKLFIECLLVLNLEIFGMKYAPFCSSTCQIPMKIHVNMIFFPNVLLLAIYDKIFVSFKN